MAPNKPATFDGYLATLKPAQRDLLEKLRRTVHAAAPGAQEYVGYGLAGFKFAGRPLVYLDAWENHCALYAANPKIQAQFAAELKGFEVSKGTIRFTVEKPLPLMLVKKLVKARAAEGNGNTAGQSWPGEAKCPVGNRPASTDRATDAGVGSDYGMTSR